MLDIWGGHADVDGSFNFTQSKVSISLFLFILWIYIWQLKCYIKSVINWFPQATNNEGSGGICVTTHKVTVSSMYRIGNYQCN
jgi:hypothetical protein